MNAVSQRSGVALSAMAVTPRNSSWPSIVLGLYFILRIFYVSEGGSVQPGDILFVAILPFLFKMRAIEQILKINPWLLGFAVLVISENVVWFFLQGSVDLGLSALYYTYNFALLIVCFAVRVGNRAAFDRYIVLALILSLLLEIVFLQLAGPANYRSAGTFSNPNQLAYWAICVMAIVVLTGRRSPLLTIVALKMLVFGLIKQPHQCRSSEKYQPSEDRLIDEGSERDLHAVQHEIAGWQIEI